MCYNISDQGVRKIIKLKRWLLVITLIFSLATMHCVFATDSIKKPVTVEKGSMQICIKGSGDKTIVMLSGFGTDNPIEDFALLSDKLSDKYKIIILEYFGYGSSDITNKERTNGNIVGEIRIALDKLGITPPYILMPHSMSGLYSLYYAAKYPSEVSGIIGIDMSLPQKQLERWKNGDFKEISQEKSDGLNISLINQWNKFYSNSKELENIKYPNKLPVLAFLATEQISSVNDMIKSGNMKTPWIDMNNDMITNDNIQIVKVLEGTHYLHHNQADKIFEISKKFIESKIKN